MGEQVIVLTDLTKQYGNFTAVDHIRLHIQKGEIFGLPVSYTHLTLPTNSRV